MADLSSKQRDKMPESAFAYVDSKGGKHLPVHDAQHVRAAISRFGEVGFESSTKKAEAQRKIKQAADRHGVKTDFGKAGSRAKENATMDQMIRQRAGR